MHYLISFVYKQAILYCIWVSSDEDYIITKNEQILFFNTIDDIKEYEHNNDIVVEKSEKTQYNLDEMLLWCDDEKNINCGCDDILNLWNICFDTANSIKKYFIGNEPVYDDLYERIVFSNDLFSQNPTPHTSLFGFSKRDILNIKKILKSGIEIITANLE